MVFRGLLDNDPTGAGGSVGSSLIPRRGLDPRLYAMVGWDPETLTARTVALGSLESIRCCTVAGASHLFNLSAPHLFNLNYDQAAEASPGLTNDPRIALGVLY